MYFFPRLRIDLQISIFEIIAQDSDFPEKALQICKSDMTNPLNGGSQSLKNPFSFKNKLHVGYSVKIFLCLLDYK
jgi:hypothetical protein